jgi:hypothetical protein
MPRLTSCEHHGKGRWRAKPCTTIPFPHEASAGSNPLTSERQYTDDELEFMRAMDRFITDKHQPFPTWCDALAVLKSLGYRKP